MPYKNLIPYKIYILYKNSIPYTKMLHSTKILYPTKMLHSIKILYPTKILHRTTKYFTKILYLTKFYSLHIDESYVTHYLTLMPCYPTTLSICKYIKTKKESHR